MDIFSYIGGLMGCWLGISVWACTGIAETTFWTILHFLKQFTKKSRLSPPDRKQLLFKRNHHNTQQSIWNKSFAMIHEKSFIGAGLIADSSTVAMSGALSQREEGDLATCVCKGKNEYSSFGKV
ncbi:hypothetical protein NPIL_7011 [Nephila pilipes]|uniref:Uncharacterized protein n=1 Tax=Nephila pilipes TaxID=299642 RepID=A0A8X6QAT1_NEPPI|nr:hypothetical protein NPIL_7011 [Nephila pilipes]